MSSTSYGYSVRHKRLAVIGPAELFVLLLLIVVAGWLVFPRNLASSLQGSKLDGLSLSYMQTWLTAKPDDYRLRLVLAQQLIVFGEYRAAEKQLHYMTRQHPLRANNALQWLQLRLYFQRLMALPPAERHASELFNRALASLGRVKLEPLTQNQQSQYGEMALILGRHKLATQAFNLAIIKARNPAQQHGRNGRLFLANGYYRQAGDEYFKAMDAAGHYSQRKRYFIKAIHALEADSLHDYALAMAAPREHIFYHDDQVLFQLLILAQAGNNLNRAQYYSARLMHFYKVPAKRATP